MSREARKKNKEGGRNSFNLNVAEIWKRKSTSNESKGGKYRFDYVQCFQYKGHVHIQRDCPTIMDEGNGNKSKYAFTVNDDNYNDNVLVIS